jgi:hypothetical protein
MVGMRLGFVVKGATCFGMHAGVRKAESSSCCICEGGQLVSADGCAGAAAAAGKGYCSRTNESQGGKQQGVRCVAVTGMAQGLVR